MILIAENVLRLKMYKNYYPIYRNSQIGEPGQPTKNHGFKPFFVGCAQKRKPYKTPAKPFLHRLRGRLHAWWSNGGQEGD